MFRSHGRWVVFVLIATVSETSSATAAEEFGRRAGIPLGISSDINDPEVQDRLMLSNAQRQQISEFEKQRQREEKELMTTPNGTRTLGWAEGQKLRESFVKRVESVLTPEQRTQWSRLWHLSNVAIFGPYRRIDQEEARDELKLRQDQLKAISDVQQEYCLECERLASKYNDLEAPQGKGFFESPFFIETRKVADNFDTRFDSLMDRILDQKQSERWSQLEWQKAADDRGVEVLLDEGAVNYLQLTTKQREQIAKLAAETAAEIEALNKNRKYADARKSRSASVQKGVELLRSDQRPQWRTMLGRPFRTPFKQAIYGEPKQP
jgi:hypothetical protein